MKELPAPTTSSALETAITRGEESAKLLPLRVTWLEIEIGLGLGFRVKVELLPLRGTFPSSARTRPEMTELDMVMSPDALLSTGESSLRSSLPEMVSVPPSLLTSAGLLRPVCSRRRLRS